MRNSILTLLFATIGLSSLAQVDTVYAKNGHVVYGEVKSMNRGVIKVETDYSENDFEIDWDKVESISTVTHFIVTTEKYYTTGTFRRASKTGQAVIVSDLDSSRLVVDVIEILKLESFDEGFFDRLKASISLGYSLQKTNNVEQLSIRSSLGYDTQKWHLSASGNTVNSSQDSVEATRRFDGNFSARRTTSAKWFLNYQIDLLQNDEQLLQLRTNQKLGVGYYLVRNHSWYFSLNTGMSWNNEEYTDQSINSLNSAEVFLSYEINLFNVKDFSLNNSVFAYYTVGGQNRTRIDTKIDLKYDMPLDFYIQLGVTHNYDSNPIQGAANTDYVLQTTFGWDL